MAAYPGVPNVKKYTPETGDRLQMTTGRFPFRDTSKLNVPGWPRNGLLWKLTNDPWSLTPPCAPGYEPGESGGWSLSPSWISCEDLQDFQGNSWWLSLLSQGSNCQFEHYPFTISFEPLYSDQYFYYLYSTENGYAAHEAYCKQACVTVGGEGGPTCVSVTDSLTTCPIGSMGITYETVDGKITPSSDPDPYPLIWAVGTNRNAVCFRYTSVYGNTKATRFKVGQVINGWTIKELKHCHMGFNFHLMTFEGSGSNFTADQLIQTITAQGKVIAGKGIKKRAIIFGKYEFREKSITHITALMNKEVPFFGDEITLPKFRANISGGKVSSVTILEAGAGMVKASQNKNPRIGIDEPISGGKQAKLSVSYNTLTGGVSSVKVIDGGSGYSNSNKPTVFLWDWDKVDEPVIIKQDEFNTDKQGVDNFYSQTPADFPFKQTLPKSKFDKIQAPLYTEQKYEKRTHPVRDVKKVPGRFRNEKTIRTRITKKQGRDFKPLPSLGDIVIEGIKQFSPSSAKVYKAVHDYQVDDLKRDYDDWPTDDPETTGPIAIVAESCVKGSFFDLPCPTRDTKYMIKEYCADSRYDASMNITLTVTPQNPVQCSSLSTPPSSSTPWSTTTTTTNPDGSTSSTTTSGFTLFSCTQCGPGCIETVVDGEVAILHDLTFERDTFNESVRRHGNPYPWFCEQDETQAYDIQPGLNGQAWTGKDIGGGTELSTWVQTVSIDYELQDTTDTAIRSQFMNPYVSYPGQFCVRWTGYLTVPETGTWKLECRTDDGNRMWINGAQILDNWQDQGADNASKNYFLLGNSPTYFQFEYYSNGVGPEEVKLYWTGPSTAKQIIPASAFSRLVAAPAPTA